jgi:hypothetical protein
MQRHIDLSLLVAASRPERTLHSETLQLLVGRFQALNLCMALSILLSLSHTKEPNPATTPNQPKQQPTVQSPPRPIMKRLTILATTCLQICKGHDGLQLIRCGSTRREWLVGVTQVKICMECVCILYGGYSGGNYLYPWPVRACHVTVGEGRNCRRPITATRASVQPRTSPPASELLCAPSITYVPSF